MLVARSGSGSGAAGFPRISPPAVGCSGATGEAAPGLVSVLGTPGAVACPCASVAHAAAVNSKASVYGLNWNFSGERGAARSARAPLRIQGAARVRFRFACPRAPLYRNQAVPRAVAGNAVFHARGCSIAGARTMTGGWRP